MDRNVQFDGRKLADLRKERFLTQREVAEVLGAAEGTISRYEQAARAGMLVKNFKKLAELLKLSPDELKAKIGVEAPNPLAQLEALAKRLGLSADQIVTHFAKQIRHEPVEGVGVLVSPPLRPPAQPKQRQRASGGGAISTRS